MRSGAPPNWQQIRQGGANGTMLCQNLLKHSPEARLRIPDALKHPWIVSLCAEGSRMETLSPEMRDQLGKRAGHSALRMTLLNLVVSKLQGESLTHYQKIWNKWDDDNSGTLSQAEFMQMMMSPEIGMDRKSAVDLYDL